MPPQQQMTAGRPPGASTEQEQGDAYFWGVDLRDPRTLPPGMLNGGENLRFDDLVAQTRKGVLKPVWANRLQLATGMVLPWGTIYGGETFKNPDGSEGGILAADGSIWWLNPNNPPLSLPLPAGVQVLGPVTFTQAFDQMFCWRGRALAPLVLRSFQNGFEDLVPQWNAAATYQGANPPSRPNADEVAYGPYIAVTSATQVGPVATVVTTAPHGYVSSADITMTGATQTRFNGRFGITVVDSNTFTFGLAPYAVTLSSLTHSGATATATATAHGFQNGDTVSISGASPAAYNGAFVISGVAANTFQYTMLSTPGSNASGTIIAAGQVCAAAGTIKCSNNSQYWLCAVIGPTTAGDSPDSAPSKWTQDFQVCPNASSALFINNMLLVPTAYNPVGTVGTDGNYATFTGGSYAKTDYLVAMNYLDPVHFDFRNDFRINQGSSDEIVDLCKWGDNTVVIWKSASWYVLSNVAQDLSQVTLDCRSEEYGLAAFRAWALAGNALLFLAPELGIVSIVQNEQSKLVGVDLPASMPVRSLVQRINWAACAGIRMESWASKLFAAVPLDGSSSNNRMLFYDFVAAARGGMTSALSGLAQNPYGWTEGDTGSALCPAGFIKLKLDQALVPTAGATVGGISRLLFWGTDGWVNLVDELDGPDQVANTNPQDANLNPMGLKFEEIVTTALTRGYFNTFQGMELPTEMALALQTWNPMYSVSAKFAGVNRFTSSVVDQTRSRTIYDRPWDAPAWNPSNVNNDQQAPNRQDYSVALPNAGMALGSGVVLNLFQEMLHTIKLKGRQSRGMQVSFSNRQGRVRLLGMRMGAVKGRERKGIQV